MSKPWHIFFFLVIIQGLVSYYGQEFILTDDLFRLTFGKQLNSADSESYISIIRKWQWISYIFIPIVLLIKVGFTWLCLKTGSYIKQENEELPIWKLSINAEVVFAIGSVLGVLYTEVFLKIDNFEKLSVNPFSLNAFFFEKIPYWLNTLFNTLNLFELFYVFTLAYLVAEENKQKFIHALKFVSSTYLLGLALWVLFVSYLSVLFQP